jgi:hypothetical protein
MNIKLTYYKQSGKFYSDAIMVIPGDPTNWPMFRVFEHVKDVLNLRMLPELVHGHSPYYVHVDPVDHPLGYPSLVVPQEWTRPLTSLGLLQAAVQYAINRLDADKSQPQISMDLTTALAVSKAAS